jgi:hypothetical protein
MDRRFKGGLFIHRTPIFVYHFFLPTAAAALIY